MRRQTSLGLGLCLGSGALVGKGGGLRLTSHHSMSHSPRTCITIPLRLTGTKCVLQIHVIWCSRAAGHTGRKSAGGQRQVGGQSDTWGKTSQQANRQNQPQGDGAPGTPHNMRARMHPTCIQSLVNTNAHPAQLCARTGPAHKQCPRTTAKGRKKPPPHIFLGSACRLGTRVCCYPTRLPAHKKMQAVGRWASSLAACPPSRAPLVASLIRPTLTAGSASSTASSWMAGAAGRRTYSVSLPCTMTVSRTHPVNANPQAHPVPTKVVEVPLDIAKGPKGKNLPGRAPLGPRLNEYERRVSWGPAFVVFRPFCFLSRVPCVLPPGPPQPRARMSHPPPPSH